LIVILIFPGTFFQPLLNGINTFFNPTQFRNPFARQPAAQQSAQPAQPAQPPQQQLFGYGHLFAQYLCAHHRE
jgi:hypothetical protein